MSSVRFVRACFAFDAGAPLLRDLSFELHAGFTGIVGANGAGKSTLARLAMGALAPTSGVVVRTPADARVALCAQSNERLDDAVQALAHDPSRHAARLLGELALDATMLTRWHALSSGERRRWQLAAALASEAELLVVDEPTNHLDDAARVIVARALSRYRGTALVVSHDRALLQALTTSTLRVHAGTATLYDAPYDDARRTWEAERERERHERALLVDERDRLRDSARAARRAHEGAAKSTSARHRMKSVHDHDARGLGAQFRADKAEQKAGRVVHVRERALRTAEARIPTVVIDRTEGRAVRFVVREPHRTRLVTLDVDVLARGNRVLARDVHVWLDRGDRVHLAGPNGAGKTTLIEHVLARVDARTREGVLFLPQEIRDARALDDIARLTSLPRDVRGHVMTIVAALGADPARVSSSALPSMGERKKLALALALAHGAHTLVLDEPTNHLDLPSRELLERALADFTGTLLFTTHDARFAGRLATSTWTLRDGHVHSGSAHAAM
jgi:ATPase subunit of ABC transporter with duplicated ATPase domains